MVARLPLVLADRLHRTFSCLVLLALSIALPCSRNCVGLSPGTVLGSLVVFLVGFQVR